MSRVRIHPRILECPFESEAGILEEVIDSGGAAGSLHMPPQEALRSAEEERGRGDYWRTMAIFYRLALWQEVKGKPRFQGETGAMVKASKQKLKPAIDGLKSTGNYLNPNAAATWLIDNTPKDKGLVWGYDIDDEDPQSRQTAIANLAERIRTLEKK